MQKQITERKSLKARALFVMAADHARKSRDYEIALAELLGYPEEGPSVYMGHLSHAIINNTPFDAAFKKEGFSVSAKPTKK